MQTDGRAPWHRILDEAHLLTIPGKQERTRAFEALLCQHFLVRFQGKLGVLHAVRPLDFHHVGNRLLPQSEMQLRRGDRLLLHQQAGAKLHLPTDAEGVNALIPGRHPGAGAKNLPLILFASLIE